ncbi:hypothetical protein AAV94_04335 [Lampropedia cohaerens]|uniref:HutD family protein n=1 Tax=Lampropedia cohaerens TaxID=1610491 RepID=A0A0U1Q1G1_9BURK|nr:HutD family protein [Lampropedia cohaerens]KKW68598.1 hypothetical protein AAV94_04335 [Lampropedia cohaerens]
MTQPRPHRGPAVCQPFNLAALAPSAWKNGGGQTREIVCWPPGSAMENFGFRISVADVVRDGPFSAFSGMDRHILLLEGAGMRLCSPQWGIDHRLEPRGAPFAFAGDAPLQCTLLEGACRDFNVMVRRDQWRASVEVAAQACTAPAGSTGLCMAMEGSWQPDGGRPLQRHQGLWWHALDHALTVTPMAAPARLVWVVLVPAADNARQRSNSDGAPPR